LHCRIDVPLGQLVIIENISGADGSIGVIHPLARAGWLRFVPSTPFVLNGAFYSFPTTC
jgi:hypothetical protein